MTADIALTLAIAALALLLFMLEWLPADITGMAVMVTLMLLGQVTPTEGISGFSNPATLSFMTPIGYQTNTMVYGAPGGIAF